MHVILRCVCRRNCKSERTSASTRPTIPPPAMTISAGGSFDDDSSLTDDEEDPVMIGLDLIGLVLMNVFGCFYCPCRFLDLRGLTECECLRFVRFLCRLSPRHSDMQCLVPKMQLASQ